MRAEDRIDAALLLLEEAVARETKAKRTRSKAFRLLQRAIDRLRNAISSEDFTAMLKQVYSPERIEAISIQPMTLLSQLGKSQ